MTKLIVISLCSLLNLVAIQSLAQVQSLDTRLKKLSFVIRGKAPSIDEYIKVNQDAHSSNADAALASKLDEYLDSYEFNLKYSNKIADMFRINQKAFSDRTNLDFSLYNTDLTENGRFHEEATTFHFVAREVLEKNQPWPELLTKKNYYITYPMDHNDFGIDIIDFYGQVTPELLVKKYITLEQIVNNSGRQYNVPTYTGVKISFSTSDKRIAGLLTTPSFLKRYPTTGVNTNRKRAAGILRSLLCKDMVAAIPVPKDGVDENKKLALAGEGNYTEQDLINHTKKVQIHGDNPECNKCHKQLDPIGSVFNLSPVNLSKYPSSGALTYYNSKGEFVNKPVDGIGELADLIAQEDDYFSCQVSNFWKWTHGENSLLNPKMEVELVQTFKNLGQKPKDFIKYLVSKKEFYAPIKYSESQIAAVDAFKTLKKCQSCHNQQSENVEIQDLDWYKLIGNPSETTRTDWIKRVTDEINQNKMPPKNAKKDFSDLEINRLKKWIALGAPSFEGK